jgi:hypothetical protein
MQYYSCCWFVVPKTLFVIDLRWLEFVNYGMFIRKVIHQRKKKKYTYFRLVENVRIDDKVKQHTIVNMGQLTLCKEKHHLLAQRIDEYLNGQQPLFNNDQEIESLAFYYAQQIKNRDSDSGKLPSAEVMLDSLEASDSRTIGSEQVGLSWFRYLEMDKMFKKLGFSERQTNLAALSILGRLIKPGSELSTHVWAKELSALGELLDDDFDHVSKNSIYEIADRIFEHKEKIENHLRKREATLFNLTEHLILYDLTNTYLEGTAEFNKKARFGRSKQKRNDCRLITMGLVVDEKGFPKKSSFFCGNQSEPETLKEMVLDLAAKREDSDKQITVVIDAGIATEDNLDALKEEGIKYVVVSRKRYPVNTEIPVVTIRDTKKEKIEARLIQDNDEKVLQIYSQQKALKEKSIKTKFEALFEDKLNYVIAGLSKPHRIKKYDKVVEHIGRLKEKYKRVSSYYHIEVVREGKLATGIKYSINDKQKYEERFSGQYFLRTNRLDLDENSIWDIYNLIRRIEKSFESLKSELGFRPIYHQKENRSDAHLFISVLAYHLLNSIEQRLKSSGDHRMWSTIRTKLSNHTRVTVSLKDKNNQNYNIRLSVKANDEQKKIYRNLLVKEMMLHPKLIPV